MNYLPMGVLRLNRNAGQYTTRKEPIPNPSLMMNLQEKNDFRVSELF